MFARSPKPCAGAPAAAGHAQYGDALAKRPAKVATTAVPPAPMASDGSPEPAEAKASSHTQDQSRPPLRETCSPKVVRSSSTSFVAPGPATK